MSDDGSADDVDVTDIPPFGDGDGDDADLLDRRASAGRRRSATTNRWMRWLHVYTSMVSFIVVLFFGITGLTLNHPSWTLGDSTDRTTSTGTLPSGFAANGAVDFLTVSEYIRGKYDISGEVSGHELSGNDGTISYRAPGYAADLFFEVDTGKFRLVVEQQGFVGVMNDLHKGRDAPGSWKWVIDISAGLLVLVSLTGLGIQLFQRKRRTRALIFAGLGLVLTVVLTYIALG